MTNFKVGMLVRVRCCVQAAAQYHGWEGIVYYVGTPGTIQEGTALRMYCPGKSPQYGLLAYWKDIEAVEEISLCPLEIWEAKYPGLKQYWNKDKDIVAPL